MKTPSVLKNDKNNGIDDKIFVHNGFYGENVNYDALYSLVGTSIQF